MPPEHDHLDDTTTALALRSKVGALQLRDPGFFAITDPPPLFLDFLPDRQLTLISAEPGSGKTMLLLDMAICLDAGLPLFGRFVPHRPATVLFVGQDAPTADYARQLRKLMVGHNLSKEQQALMETTVLLNGGMSLADKSFFDWLLSYHAATGFDVLMLDTLLSLIPGIDENSNTLMNPIMGILKKLRDELGIAVFFSHHTAKPSANTVGLLSGNYRVRGASVISGSIDYHLQLAAKGPVVRLTTPKARGAIEKRLDHFTILESITPLGPSIRLEATVTRLEKVEQEFARVHQTRGSLLAYIKQQEPHLTEEQAEAAVNNSLAVLKAAGKITNSDTPRGVWRRC